MSETFRAIELRAGNHFRLAAPVVSGLPAIGNLYAFLQNPLDLMYAGYRQHGPVFRISLIGGKLHVLAGPESALAITKEERTYFRSQGLLDSAARIFETSNDCMMVALDGERHREVRGHQKVAMSRNFFAKHLAEAAALADGYFAALPIGQSLPITDFAKRLIFSQVGQVMAGEYSMDLFEPAKIIMDTLVNTLVKPWTNLLPYHPKAKAALRRFQIYAEALQKKAGNVDGARADLNYSQTIFAGVQAGMYQKRDVPLLLSGPYIAGLDTAAHALAFALYGALVHPGIVETLREEIDATLAPGERVTVEKLRHMHLLRGAVMESMRVHPVTVLQTRTALIDFLANGCQIRKGDRVLFAPTVSHRMKEFYPNPEVFDIRRYGKDRSEHLTPGAFQPYGVGPHICLGAGVADAIIALNLMSILRSYDVELTPRNYHLKVKMIPTPAPVDLHIRFWPRGKLKPVASRAN